MSDSVSVKVTHLEFEVKLASDGGGAFQLPSKTVKFIYDGRALVTIDEGRIVQTLTKPNVSLINLKVEEQLEELALDVNEFIRGLLGERTGPPPGKPTT